MKIQSDGRQNGEWKHSCPLHPCAHLLLDKDIREEIGIIHTKAKTGNKDAVYAAYIDGATADAYGYLKMDYLRVDVVKIIADTFASIGMPVMPVDKLIEEINNDPEVWSLYANGFTMGLNQCEKEKTTERVMRYKPKNIVELAAFVAAVRPGFKSMLETFISRTPFAYNIPSLDALLQTKEIPSSFLMFDEQILTILQQGGISAADAYVCIKAIKKKKADKVASFKAQFEPGFSKYLMESEGASEEDAKAIVDKIWTIVNDAASYMFCAAHAFSMACDSAYCAWLKVHYPFELYKVMLKRYNEKGNKEKISLIISQMKRYKDISLITGRFGQDNRDWYVDKEANTISQSLSSIKYISQTAADELWNMHDKTFDTFTDLLRCVHMETCLNSRQMQVLTKLGYFDSFGKTGKLLKILDEYYNGKNNLKNKTLKSFEKRLAILREIERSENDVEMPISDRLAAQNDLLGFCISTDRSSPTNYYFISQADQTYGVKIYMYNVNTGKSGIMKMSKKSFAEMPTENGRIICLDKWAKRPVYSYKGGTRTVIPEKYDYWIENFHHVN